jgi:putative ABC transport system substrate-binding protein
MRLRGRRRVLFASVALLAAARAHAQATGRAIHLATISDSHEGGDAARWQVFYDRLRELGYREGWNLRVSARYSQGAQDRLPALAAELVALAPDVIACGTTPATHAVKRATTTIPVVFIGAAEPVETGLVASLSRPGGNVTGTAIMSAEMSGKWIEMLREISPGAKKFAFLGQASNQGIAVVYRSMQAAATAIGATARLMEATSAVEVESAFAEIARGRYDAFMVASAPVLLPQRQQIVELAARHRIPGLYARDEYVAAGGLMSYTPDRRAYFRRAAELVHRIIEGTRPADLPVERPTKFELIVNLKTAAAIGLKIPASILLRADRVIE